MKKTYKVTFTEEGKGTYIFEFTTDNIQKAISEYCRNRAIVSYGILEEQTQASKQLLLG